MTEKAILMDAQSMERALVRMSHQIIEANSGTDALCLVGVKTRGVPLSRMVADNIFNITGVKPDVGVLDITLYRDDLSEVTGAATVNSTDIPFSIVGKHVVLVDDVIYTGRTARAALDALINLGRPARISLAVMIDRGHRELPIRPDYVGKNVPTSRGEVVAVRLNEIDGREEVALCSR